MQQDRKNANAGFARRLATAISESRDIPLGTDAANQWLAERIYEIGGRNIHKESVRKWRAGDTAPSAETMIHLAQVLGVDPIALADGTRAGKALANKQNAARLVVSQGVPADDVLARGLALGLVHCAGGLITERTSPAPVHFRAQIKGAEYSFHAVLGTPDQRGGWHFVVPDGLENVLVLGIMPSGPFRFRLVDLDVDTVQRVGTPAPGGGLTVTIDKNLKTRDAAWREIENLDRRP